MVAVLARLGHSADEAGDYLRQLPGFSGERLLVIHTTRSGEITKDDLDLARRAARDVDGPDSPIRCILSVLMLACPCGCSNTCTGSDAVSFVPSRVGARIERNVASAG